MSTSPCRTLKPRETSASSETIEKRPDSCHRVTMMPPNQTTKARFSAQKTMCISYSPCSSYEKCCRQ
tara:strand:- start:1520 stop:1720 length:201 start_codon:yes stop_codon:yes gene_type:complete